MDEKRQRWFKQLEKDITKYVGPRCDNWSLGCFGCATWRAYDDLYDGFNWDF